MNTTKVHDLVRHFIFNIIDFFYGPFKKWIPLHTFRYAACGGGNTVFDILLFTICYNFIFKKQNFHIAHTTLSPYIASLFLSFSISFCSGFYLNRYIVFKESGLRKSVQLYRFIAVNIICIVLNTIFLKFFVGYLGLYPTIAKVIATVIIAIISYLVQTHFFFKLKEDIIHQKD
jgi:putative flippase GtrA